MVVDHWNPLKRGKKLHVGCHLQGSLQGMSSVRGSLSFVDIEFGIGKLGSHLGRKRTALAALGFNGHSHRSSILLALESLLGGVIVVQEVCKIMEDSTMTRVTTNIKKSVRTLQRCRENGIIQGDERTDCNVIASNNIVKFPWRCGSRNMKHCRVT